jgi:hypothetical protein
MSGFGAAVPIFRIFDLAKAKEFYVDFLEFVVDWEAEIAPGSPVYLQVSRGACVLNLSEHFGDATPGSAARVRVDDLDAYQQKLLGKNYRHARPGVLEQTWGAREMIISDPFNNRIVFWEPSGTATAPAP